jgi:hypothetical protein
MFDKYKERWAKLEEDHEKIRQIRIHLEDNKQTYLLVAGAFGAGMVVRGRAPEIKQVIKPRNTMGLAYKSSQIMNTIVLPAKGDPGDVVQNLRTLETYPSKGELARELGIARAIVSKYFSGELPDLLGDQYGVIGKAGHPIPLA